MTLSVDIRKQLGDFQLEAQFQAKEEALALRDIFGEDNFFLELQDQGLDEELKILPYMNI